MNEQQREAVAHIDGPLLLLAGAGSGKTRVITHRIAHLIETHRVPGPAVLAVTFTNKAADEMRQRVLNLLTSDSGSKAPTVSTFHSFCVRALRRDGNSLAEIRPGFTRQFTIYDADDQVSLLRSIYKQLGLDEKFMQYRAMLSRISHGKSHNESPLDWYKAATDPKLTRFAKIYELYEERLKQANALDFDDLLLETVRLLKHDNALRSLYNQRYGYVMIDEYQDTNRSQYELMRALTETRHNICVVGDEDQSIYGWRGADIRNILDFERDYPDAVVIRLEQNYRSTKNILEAASSVVANNKERKGKWLWTSSGAGAKIGYYEAPDGENEALFIADTIEKVLSKSPGERVAVLYRTNFQSRQIEEALRRYGRKYLVVGGFSFYQRAEVKDLLSYLKLALSPQDSVSLLRVINTPARGIGKSTVEQMEQFALERSMSLWNALPKMVEERVFATRAESAIKSFIKLMEELGDSAKTKPVHEVLRDILEKTGYETMLKSDAAPEAESRLGNVEELVNAAAEAAERGENAAEFLDHAALVAEADSVDQNAPVSLLTVHNAKGLEFGTVLVAGLEEGIFPHSRSLTSEAAMEEERRLCYVAMTRAEKRLYLTWARYRRKFGGSQPEVCLPSRFLNEVPASLRERLSPHARPDTDEVDLFAEQDDVRQSVKRNLYTGRTYNSVENISQFFAERGMPPPSGFTRRPEGSPPQTQKSDPVTQGKVPGTKTPIQMPVRGGQSARPPAEAPRSGNPPAGSDRQPSGQANLFGGSRQTGPQLVPPKTNATRTPQPASTYTPGVQAPPPAGSGNRVPGGRSSAVGIRSGTIVQHTKYGRGTVLRREGEGEDAKLTISFPGYGLKKIVEKFAGIIVDQ